MFREELVMRLLLFDMGLPMIFPSMFLMAVALVPVIFLEGYIIAARLQLDLKKIVNRVALANLASTFVGIPITWFLLTLLQLVTGGGGGFPINTFWGKLLAVTWQAPWVLPRGNDEGWIADVSMLSLLIPYCLASWLLEYWIIRRKLSTLLYQKSAMYNAEDPPNIQLLETESFFPDISKAVRKSNFASYGILAGFLVLLLLTGVGSK